MLKWQCSRFGPTSLRGYKYGGNQPVECLTLLYQLAWKVHQWDRALISPLFKGGPDHNNIWKYSAITLLCSSSKLYEAVLLASIQKVLDACRSMSDTQGGFKRNTTSHERTLGLHLILHQRKAAKVPTYVASINFETAFSTTFKPLVWVRLAQAGIKGPLWEVTRQLYSDVKSRVAHQEIPPDEFFEIPQGLRKGSKLSPLLFNLAVNDMESKLLQPYPDRRRAPGVWVPSKDQSGRHTRMVASV
jgi:hypothetical protein